MSVSRIIPSAALIVLAFAGCRVPASSDNMFKERKFEISYSDRNGDGVVDYEYHRLPGVADADWKLEDSDFDGRYDKRTTLGYSIMVKTVDQPVPKGVKFSKFSSEFLSR